MNKMIYGILVSVLTLAACETKYTVEKNAVFTMQGNVTDSYGHTMVLSPSSEVQLCVRANYTTDIGYADTYTGCSDLITDQNGGYFVKQTLNIKSTSAKLIEIKSAKIFGKYSVRTSQGGIETYLFPVSIKSIDLTQAGGTINADISVFNLD